MLRSFEEERLRILATAAWLLTGLLGTGAFERLVLPVFPPAPALAPFGVVLYLLWLLLRELGEHAEKASDSKLRSARVPAMRAGGEDG